MTACRPLFFRQQSSIISLYITRHVAEKEMFSKRNKDPINVNRTGLPGNGPEIAGSLFRSFSAPDRIFSY
jgi:hypothetical protein